MRHLKFYLILLVSLFWSSVSGTSLIDSLDVWAKDLKFKSICGAADELLAKKSKDISSCDQVRLLTAASSASIDLFEPDKSLRYAQEARRAGKNCSDSAIVYQARMREAIAQNMLGKMDIAVKLTDEVIGFAQKSNNQKLLRSAYTNLGMMLNKIGEYNEALQNFEKALEIVRQNPEDRGLQPCILTSP